METLLVKLGHTSLLRAIVTTSILYIYQVLVYVYPTTTCLEVMTESCGSGSERGSLGIKANVHKLQRLTAHRTEINYGAYFQLSQQVVEH